MLGEHAQHPMLEGGNQTANRRQVNIFLIFLTPLVAQKFTAHGFHNTGKHSALPEYELQKWTASIRFWNRIGKHRIGPFSCCLFKKVDSWSPLRAFSYKAEDLKMKALGVCDSQMTPRVYWYTHSTSYEMNWRCRESQTVSKFKLFFLLFFLNVWSGSESFLVIYLVFPQWHQTSFYM